MVVNTTTLPKFGVNCFEKRPNIAKRGGKRHNITKPLCVIGTKYHNLFK